MTNNASGLDQYDDSLLTIYVQKDNPDQDKESNWLPAPEDDFRPIVRMCQPRQEALDNTFVLPPIRRVE